MGPLSFSMKAAFPKRAHTLFGLSYFALHLSSIYIHQAWIYLAYEVLFLGYIILGIGKEKMLLQAGILHILLTAFYIPELFYTRGLSLSNPLSALVFYPAAHFLLLIIVAGINNKRKKHLRKLS
jgi:hypothetical protein